MSAFDPLGAAVDWLDAYRARALSILDLYADDATILCGCGGEKQLADPQARRSYWTSRFAEKPATGLVDLEHRGGDVVAITYRTPMDVVQAVLSFDAASGLITLQRCRPL